jgi:antitoxin component of MazEF toxin-antitoxin module
MNVQAKIKKWGNSHALRLSAPMAALPRFKKDMLVNVHITEEGIAVKPVVSKRKKTLPFSASDLLEGLTVMRA